MTKPTEYFRWAPSSAAQVMAWLSARPVSFDEEWLSQSWWMDQLLEHRIVQWEQEASPRLLCLRRLCRQLHTREPDSVPPPP